ncbi:MAG: hypothetical protein AB1505_14255 [Candidatus Latescibacterota bacterium]
MRRFAALLAVLSLVVYLGCGDQPPPAGPTSDQGAAKLTVSGLAAGGFQGRNRPTPEVSKSMLIYGLGHPTIAEKTPRQVAQMLDNMGLNHVVFGGMPYDAEPMNSIIDELHRRGIKVYGETTQFHGWDATIPASRPTNALGDSLPQVEWYQGVNPSVPDVFEKALAKWRTSVDRHPNLDGMWMDFIRWPLHWEVRDWEEGETPYQYDSSFDEATLARFEEASGIDIPDNLDTASARADWIYANAPDEFGEWKTSVINDFVRQAHDYLKSTGQHKLLGAFTVPWRTDYYDEAILKIVGQDYAAMAEWVDVFSPMAYYDMMGGDGTRYSTDWLGEIATYTKQVTGRTTIPIVMAFSISLDKYGDELTAQELRDSVTKTATAPGSDGVMLFWYNSIMDTGRLPEVVDALAALP